MEIEALETSCSLSFSSVNPSVALVCLLHKAHALYLYLPQFSEIGWVQILKSLLAGMALGQVFELSILPSGE